MVVDELTFQVYFHRTFKSLNLTRVAHETVELLCQETNRSSLVTCAQQATLPI